jgi:uncharacterized protein YyaL (SSP411 family)
VRRLAERAPRFAGWSLAAAVSALDGPKEIVVVTEPGDPVGAELAHRARKAVGAVVLVVPPGRRGIPLLEGRDLVHGRAAAYVCQNLVCERPVTDPEELTA